MTLNIILWYLLLQNKVIPPVNPPAACCAPHSSPNGTTDVASSTSAIPPRPICSTRLHSGVRTRRGRIILRGIPLPNVTCVINERLAISGRPAALACSPPNFGITKVLELPRARAEVRVIGRCVHAFVTPFDINSNYIRLFLCVSRRERRTDGLDEADLEEQVLMAEPGGAGGEALVAAAAPVTQARGRVRNIYRARVADPLKVLAKARLLPSPRPPCQLQSSLALTPGWCARPAGGADRPPLASVPLQGFSPHPLQQEGTAGRLPPRRRGTERVPCVPGPPQRAGRGYCS